MVSKPAILAVYRPITLQNLRNGIPIGIIHLDAMRLHPVSYSHIRPSYHIPHRMQLLPQHHLEAVTDTGMQTYLPAWRQIIEDARILRLKCRQQDFHLSRQGP